MAALLRRLQTLARDPRTRAAIDRARREAAKPENRRRLADLRARFGGRRR